MKTRDSNPDATGPAAGAPLRRSEAREPETAQYSAVPGLVETTTGHGEVTLVVEPPELIAPATYLRDELGFGCSPCVADGRDDAAARTCDVLVRGP